MAPSSFCAPLTSPEDETNTAFAQKIGENEIGILRRIALVETALSENWFGLANFQVKRYANKIWWIFVQERISMTYISPKYHIYGYILSLISANFREFRLVEKFKQKAKNIWGFANMRDSVFSPRHWIVLD
ncbi:MAG: hypothetical protein KJ069_21360 [Anaerolineae bacterium]|nr:hypothetical protein [Anaerolineae bacterium]